MKDTSKHVAVIGAGPAGAVAAIRLRQFGHRVTLIEKAKFPRDKVCGECVSATGIDVLERVGAANVLRETDPNILRRATAVAADGSSVTVDLPRPMWGITRRTMDAVLADHAASLGVNVRMNTAATLRERDARGKTQVENLCHGRSVALVCDGVRETITADVVILADGRGRSLGPTDLTGDLGIKAHFHNVDAPRDTIELVGVPAIGGYAGLAAVNGDLWNAAWSVPAAVVRAAGGDIDRVFRDALAASATLRRRFRDAARVGEWLACPLPRYAVRRGWPTNVIPIGNAAAALEPVGGEGMGLAMRSGELAAEAIDTAARADWPIDTRSLRQNFDRLWTTRRAGCRTAAVMLGDRRVGPFVVDLAATVPSLARLGMRLIGKS